MSWELYCGLHSVRQKDRRRTSRGGLHRESRKSKHQTQDVISISGWSRLSAADQEGESKKGALKTAKGNKKTIFFLDHCSSCRFKSCVDDFKVIYLTPRCEFVIKKKIPRGDAELEEEEEEMAASQVYVLSWVWGCVLFLLKCLV